MNEKEVNYEKSLIDIKKEIEDFSSFKDVLPIFLSEESIRDVKNFVDNKNNFRKGIKEVKILWKSLLIDSLSCLKLNDIRESINKCFTEEQEKLPIKISENRLLNSYGIDELDKYLDDFVQFESVLYGSDSHYRDHVNHVIQVWLIGLVLLLKNDNYKYIKYSDNLQFVDKNYSYSVKDNSVFNVPKNKKAPFYITKSEELSMWTIISLCHDLGYPLEKASNINLKLKNILNHFGSLNIQEFSYNFNILNSFLVEKFLNIVSSKVVLCKDKSVKDFYTREKNLKQFGHTCIQSKYRDKISKSLEDNRHGVLSGLLLFKTLTYFLECDYSYSINDQLTYEDLRQFSIRKEILRAITGHTCPKLYHLDVRNFSFLLILCDELHEWERPNFDDMRNGDPLANSKKVKVYLDQFSFDKKIINEIEPGKDVEALIRVRLEDNADSYLKNSLTIERGIYKKFKTLHHLLRSAKDDEKRNFLFRWKYVYKSKKKTPVDYVFRFRFDASLDASESIDTHSFILKDGKRLYDNTTKLKIYEELSENNHPKKYLDVFVKPNGKNKVKP